MLETKTLVKICGITSIEQAVQVAELGTNAIGIISVDESPRYISSEKEKVRHIRYAFLVPSRNHPALNNNVINEFKSE